MEGPSGPGSEGSRVFPECSSRGTSWALAGFGSMYEILLHVRAGRRTSGSLNRRWPRGILLKMKAINTSIETAARQVQDASWVRAICPHCGSGVHFELIADVNLRGTGGWKMPSGPDAARIIALGCPACMCVSLLFGNSPDKMMPARTFVWPLSESPDRAPGGLDQEIKKFYDQARSIIASSPDGAAVLTRRCLQQVIRTRLPIKHSSLFKEIEEAIKCPELSKPTADALGHIRDIGNWSAHPILDESDTLIEVTREEAEYTLQTLELCFDDLYVKTSRVEEMTKRIAAKKKGQQQAAPSNP